MRFKGNHRFRNALMVIPVLLLAGGLWLWQEPFEPRYQGKTLRGWFREVSSSGELPPREVVDHYGLGATEFLMRQVAPPVVPLPVRWEERYFEWLSEQPDYRAAVGWLRLLADSEPAPSVQLPGKKTAGLTE